MARDNAVRTRHRSSIGNTVAMGEGGGHDTELTMLRGYPALVTAGRFDELQARYFDWIGAHLPSFAYGLYLHDTRTGRPRLAEVRGLSRFYVNRYERFGRDLDPVLRGALATGQAFDDSLVAAGEVWEQTPIVRELFRQHDMAHVMCAPVFSGDDVVGTINFARHGDDVPFDEGDRHRATLASALFAAAVAATDLVMSIDAERAAWWGALEASGQAIVVTDIDRAERHLNRAARELLAGDEAVWPALDAAVGAAAESNAESSSAGVHRISVARSNGGRAELLVSSAQLVDRPDIVVSTVSAVAAVGSLDAAVRRLLTDREATVAELVAAGCRDAEIARRLYISANTVKHHLKAVYLKLGVHSRVELAALVLR